MVKALAEAVNDLLETIRSDAESSFAERGVFNNVIWKKHDPEYYHQWRLIKDLMKKDGL